MKNGVHGPRWRSILKSAPSSKKHTNFKFGLPLLRQKTISALFHTITRQRYRTRARYTRESALPPPSRTSMREWKRELRETTSLEQRCYDQNTHCFDCTRRRQLKRGGFNIWHRTGSALRNWCKYCLTTKGALPASFSNPNLRSFSKAFLCNTNLAKKMHE